MSYSVRLSRTKKKVTKNITFKEPNDLAYDSTSDDDSIKEYLSQKHKINLDLISKLPNHKIEEPKKKTTRKKTTKKKSTTKTKKKSTTKTDKKSNTKLEKKSKISIEDNGAHQNDMIDKDNLKKDYVGGKIVYYDYDKNIIYNGAFNVIGTVTEEGDIELIPTYERIYKKLLFSNPVHNPVQNEVCDDLEDNDTIDADQYNDY